MATKKQKRERGLAKFNARMEAYREEGRKALQKDRARRFNEKLREWEKVHNEKHHKFVSECPHCLVIRKASKKEDANVS